MFLSSGTTSRLIASCLGLSGFAVAVVAGLAAENPGGRILAIALVCMIGCHLVGLAIGMVGERVIEDYMRQYKASRPVESGAGGGGGGSPSTSGPGASERAISP